MASSSESGGTSLHLELNKAIKERNTHERASVEWIQCQTKVDELTAVLVQSAAQQLSYDPHKVEKTSPLAVDVPFYVHNQIVRAGDEKNAALRFRVSRILPFGQDIIAKGQVCIEDEGRRLAFKIREGSMKKQKKTPIQTGRIDSKEVFEIILWNQKKQVSIKPGRFYRFNKFSAIESWSPKHNTWFLEAKADSITPWPAAPLPQHMYGIVERFHSGRNFNLYPCDLAALPTETEVIAHMEAQGLTKEDGTIDFDERRKECLRMVSEKLKDRPDLEIFKPWGKSVPLIPFTVQDSSSIGGEQPRNYFSSIAWHSQMLVEVKRKEGDEGDEGAIDLDAGAAGSAGKPDYPFPYRLAVKAQAQLISREPGIACTVDVAFVGTGFAEAFGITNPYVAEAVVKPIVAKVPIAFGASPEMNEMVFNAENAKSLSMNDPNEQVVILKVFNDVYLRIRDDVLRKFALPVTREYAFDAVNKFIRESCPGSEVSDDSVDLSLLVNARSAVNKRIYQYYLRTNTLAQKTDGKIINLGENAAKINTETADEWHFYSLSNAILNEDALQEFRERSANYFSTADAADAAFFEDTKKAFAKQLKVLRVDGKRGSFVSSGGAFIEAIFAVKKELDHDKNYHVYRNPAYLPSPSTPEERSSEASSSSSSSFSSPSLHEIPQTTVSVRDDKEEKEDDNDVDDNEEEEHEEETVRRKPPILAIPTIRSTAKRASAVPPSSPKKPTPSSKRVRT